MASTDIQDCCSEGGKICRLPVDFCCGLWSAKVEVGRHACSRSLAIQWNKDAAKGSDNVGRCKLLLGRCCPPRHHCEFDPYAWVFFVLKPSADSLCVGTLHVVFPVVEPLLLLITFKSATVGLQLFDLCLPMPEEESKGGVPSVMLGPMFLHTRSQLVGTLIVSILHLNGSVRRTSGLTSARQLLSQLATRKASSLKTSSWLLLNGCGEGD